MPRRREQDPTAVLGEREVASSTELVRRLEASGFRHARKILERSFRTKGIWRSQSVVLPSGGRLFARFPFYGTAEFLQALRPWIEQSRPGLARVMQALDRFPALDIDTVKKLLAVPLDSKAGGSKFDRELAALLEAGIGVTDDSGTARLRLIRKKLLGTEEGTKLGFQLLAENETQRHLLALLMRHYRQQNLITWNTPEPGQPHVYNKGQMFSTVAYSRLRPMQRKRDGKWKACAVPFESLARPAELFDIEGFIERLHRAGDHKNSHFRPLGVFGARSFSPEALRRGKEFGLAMVNYKELFGDAGLAAITNAQQLLASLTDNSAADSPGAADSLAQKLADSMAKLKDNPMVSALCGVAFETFAVAVLRGRPVEGVTAGLDVPFDDNGVETTRDVDASGNQDDVWFAIECKALKAEKSVDEETVRKFYTETVPAFLRYVGKNNVRELRAEIWTTGTVSSETLGYFKTLRLDRRVKARILTRPEIEIPRKIASLARIMDVIASL